MLWPFRHTNTNDKDSYPQSHTVYTESSLSEKSATQFLLHITAANSCKGVNVSLHLLESKFQQAQYTEAFTPLTT